MDVVSYRTLLCVSCRTEKGVSVVRKGNLKFSKPIKLYEMFEKLQKWYSWYLELSIAEETIYGPHINQFIWCAYHVLLSRFKGCTASVHEKSLQSVHPKFFKSVEWICKGLQNAVILELKFSHSESFFSRCLTTLKWKNMNHCCLLRSYLPQHETCVR